MATRNALMRKVRSLHCKGLCQESCGPICFGESERRKVQQYCRERGIEFHDLTKEGALELFLNSVMNDTDETCPYLKDGRCSIYPVRPMICRLWGAVETMRCPFGCVPELGYLNDEEARGLLTEAMG